MKTKKAHVSEFADRIPLRRLANDCQTPLCVIISAGELLENYFERLSPEQCRLAPQDILNAARQINQTIDSFAACEKPEKPLNENPARQSSGRRRSLQIISAAS